MLRVLPALVLLFAAGAVSAQPIIIPLEKQPAETPAPVASAPPVAPPIAAPTQPTGLAEEEPTRGDAPPKEEAYQPPAK